VIAQIVTEALVLALAAAMLGLVVASDRGAMPGPGRVNHWGRPSVWWI